MKNGFTNFDQWFGEKMTPRTFLISFFFFQILVFLFSYITFFFSHTIMLIIDINCQKIDALLSMFFFFYARCRMLSYDVHLTDRRLHYGYSFIYKTVDNKITTMD